MHPHTWLMEDAQKTWIRWMNGFPHTDYDIPTDLNILFDGYIYMYMGVPLGHYTSSLLPGQQVPLLLSLSRTSNVSALQSQRRERKWLAQGHTATKWYLPAWKQGFWPHTQALHTKAGFHHLSPCCSQPDSEGSRKWDTDPSRKKHRVDTAVVYTLHKKDKHCFVPPTCKCTAATQTFRTAYWWFPNGLSEFLQSFEKKYIYIYRLALNTASWVLCQPPESKSLEVGSREWGCVKDSPWDIKQPHLETTSLHCWAASKFQTNYMSKGDSHLGHKQSYCLIHIWGKKSLNVMNFFFFFLPKSLVLKTRRRFVSPHWIKTPWS